MRPSLGLPAPYYMPRIARSKAPSRLPGGLVVSGAGSRGGLGEGGERAETWNVRHEWEEQTTPLKIIYFLWVTAAVIMGVPGVLVYAVFPGTRDWLILPAGLLFGFPILGLLMWQVLAILPVVGDIAKTVLVWLSPDV